MGPNPAIQQYLVARASQLGLDPNAVVGIEHHEGWGGGVGDNGTSFGPFQLHQGGALPGNIPLGQAQQWAWSKPGIDYALGKMAGVAGGLKGKQAVAAISTRFERPSNPGAEIADAMNWYGKSGNPGSAGAVPQVAGLNLGSGTGSAQQSLAALMLQQSSQTALGNMNPSSILGMAMARQQAQAQQSVYGQGSSTVSLGNLNVKGVNPASPHDAAAVKTVESFIGTPYVWGGANPKGFDCSGLLQYTWKQQGVNIPRTTYDQWKVGQTVSQSQLRAGDAVFFKGSDSKNGLPGHVGMYIGGGKFVEAPHTGSTVHISTLAGRTDYMGARRYG